MAMIKDTKNTDMTILSEFMEAQRFGSGGHETFVLVEKLVTRFNVCSDRMLVLFSQSDGTLSQIVPITLLARVLLLC